MANSKLIELVDLTNKRIDKLGKYVESVDDALDETIEKLNDLEGLVLKTVEFLNVFQTNANDRLSSLEEQKDGE